MNGLLLILVLWLTGTALLLLIRWQASLLGMLTEFPTTLAAGAVLLHLLFLVASWFGTVSPWSYGLLAAIAAMATIMRSGRCGISSVVAHGKTPLTLSEVVGLVLLLAIQLVLLWPSLSLPLFDWDARILWVLKAEHLTAQATVASDFFRDPYQLHIHPRYPLLVPWLTAVLAGGQEHFPEGAFRAVLLGGALLATWQLYLGLLRKARLKVACSATLVLILTGAWLKSQLDLQVELVLAFFVLLALCRLADWLENGRYQDLLLAALFFAGAIMTKNEGLLLLVCSAVGLGLVLPRGAGLNRRTSQGVGLLVLSVLLSLPWLVQRAAIPPVSDENYLARISPEILAAAWSRWPEVLDNMARQMADWHLWHIFWPSLVLVTGWVLVCWRRSRPEALLAALVWWGYLAGVVFVYCLSPWRDIALQIEVSFTRVMLPLLPVGLLLLGLSVVRRETTSCDD